METCAHGDAPVLVLTAVSPQAGMSVAWAPYADFDHGDWQGDTPDGARRDVPSAPLSSGDTPPGSVSLAALRRALEMLLAHEAAWPADQSFFVPCEDAARGDEGFPVPFATSGLCGSTEDADIPDTPLDEWKAGVEAFLQEWEARHTQAGHELSVD